MKQLKTNIASICGDIATKQFLPIKAPDSFYRSPDVKHATFQLEYKDIEGSNFIQIEDF